MKILAIDPGDVHVGMAYGMAGRVIRTWETTPDACIEEVIDWIESPGEGDDLDALVVERFVLYPWKAKDQAFSSMKTAEMIGVLRWVWRSIGEKAGIEWVEQNASIQKPTAKIAKAKGIQRVSAKGQPHALSAELHLLHYVLRQGEED